STEEALHRWFDKLEKAPKQLHLLMRFVELSQCLTNDPQEVKREHLLRSAGAKGGDLKKLTEKGLFDLYERPAGSLPSTTTARAHNLLSDVQSTALGELRTALDARPVALLQGVTASGKTELYMELIAEAMARGEQTLYLLPEIALTTQVIGRLRAR